MSIENLNINTTFLKQLVEILKVPYKDWTLKNFIDFCSLSDGCNFGYLLNRYSSDYVCPFCFFESRKRYRLQNKKFIPLL